MPSSRTALAAVLAALSVAGAAGFAVAPMRRGLAAAAHRPAARALHRRAAAAAEDGLTETAEEAAAAEQMSQPLASDEYKTLVKNPPPAMDRVPVAMPGNADEVPWWGQGPALFGAFCLSVFSAQVFNIGALNGTPLSGLNDPKALIP